jgi:putative FmdB family regulatory protein
VPTYEYRCKACGQHLEAVQAFTDDPLTECPSCGGELRKVFGSVGISFKGSGFYKTDSRGSSSAKAGSTGSKDAGSSDSGSSDSGSTSSGSSSDTGSSSGSGDSSGSSTAKSA